MKVTDALAVAVFRWTPYLLIRPSGDDLLIPLAEAVVMPWPTPEYFDSKESAQNLSSEEIVPGRHRKFRAFTLRVSM